MIAEFLYRNPRILILMIAVIGVAGLSAWFVLPRMEDPVLGKRVAVISTVFPGADTERVETLVTARLEEKLQGLAGIEEVRSTSRSGISNIVIELRDDVTDVDTVWSRVRDRLDDADADLPEQTLAPEFQVFELKAFAAIIAVKWNRAETSNVAILRRLARKLKSALGEITGTDRVETFGDPGEEYVVEISADVLAALGLSTGAIARQVADSDATQPAGLVRSGSSELLLDVDQPLDSLQRLGQTPIQYGTRSQTVNLADIADIRQGTIQPPPQMAFIDGQRSVVLGVYVRDNYRVDRWTDRMDSALQEFGSKLPPGIETDLIFAQRIYVDQRLTSLLRNLMLGTLAVMLVVFLLMGWRSTIIVGTALPLSALLVLAGLRVLDIPIHQMSVTGLIIALGLLIDNAIVIVDEVRARVLAGMTRTRAIRQGVRHLAMPLFGSTLTTTLAFLPIATLPGPPGEFVGTIAISVILAINASFLLAMTVVPALTGLLRISSGGKTLISYGLVNQAARATYEKSLDVLFRKPWLGVALGAALPLLGYWQARQLPEQFFPASDRNQIQIEIELPARASVTETRQRSESIRQVVIDKPEVRRMHWFVGESGPTFFYNVVPRRRGTSFYAQALVDVQPGTGTRSLVRQLQQELDRQFADCRVLVRQLEQGPPFDAPVEIRLRGPDLAVLDRLGSRLRLLLTQTSNVIHTRSDMEEAIPKLVLQIDEQQSRRAGLSRTEVARQMYSTLEGSPAGFITDGFDEAPIRVRLSGREGLRLEQLAALEMFNLQRRPSAARAQSTAEGGTPLSAIARMELGSEVGAITRVGGQRMNEVKAFIRAGTLPSTVVDEFRQRMAASDYELPAGYTMEFGGETEERNEAVGNLLANALLVAALILLTLVVSFRSFRCSLIIAAVGCLSVGLGPGALWWFGYPFGFMAIVGTMGLVGIAINDAIVVMAGIRANPAARAGDVTAIRDVVVQRTRHVLATTLTTIAGFTPLVLGGGGFWPPLAITIAGGVGGATLLALYVVPSLYLLLMVRRPRAKNTTQNVA